MSEARDVPDVMGLVKAVAWPFVSRLPRGVDRDDIVSAGSLGYAQAAQDYDPALGTPFVVWAAMKIRWAITNYMRDDTWAPRRVRNPRRLANLPVAEMRWVPDKATPSPVEGASRTEWRGRIPGLLARLRPKRRAVIERHYLRGDPFHEIADDMGYSKTLISQLHLAGLDDLRRLARSA